MNYIRILFVSTIIVGCLLSLFIFLFEEERRGIKREEELPSSTINPLIKYSPSMIPIAEPMNVDNIDTNEMNRKSVFMSPVAGTYLSVSSQNKLMINTEGNDMEVFILEVIEVTRKNEEKVRLINEQLGTSLRKNLVFGDPNQEDIIFLMKQHPDGGFYFQSGKRSYLSVNSDGVVSISDSLGSSESFRLIENTDVSILEGLNGFAEAFFWDEDNQYEGQWNEFTQNERQEFLTFLGQTGFNTYYYDPKMIREQNKEISYIQQRSFEWESTFEIAKESGITFLWALAPGWIENEPVSTEPEIQRYMELVDYLIYLGVGGIVLAFDDSGGAATRWQMEKQIQLFNVLSQSKVVREKLFSFAPGIYADYKAHEAGFSTPEEGLDILHQGLPVHHALIYTGAWNWNLEMSASSFPELGERKFVFFDNHVAADRIDFITVGPPRIREESLFDVIKGYWLNGMYPAMRNVPIMASLGKIIESRGARIGDSWGYFPEQLLPHLEEAALQWSQYLKIPEYEGQMLELMKGLCELDYKQSAVDELPYHIFKEYIDHLASM